MKPLQLFAVILFAISSGRFAMANPPNESVPHKNADVIIFLDENHRLRFDRPKSKAPPFPVSDMEKRIRKATKQRDAAFLVLSRYFKTVSKEELESLVSGLRNRLLAMGFKEVRPAHFDKSDGSSRSPVLSFPADTSAVEDMDDDYSYLNRNSKQRIGSFYEITYLPTATKNLIEAANLSSRQRPPAFEILRAYIYDYLDASARNSGTISPKQSRRVIDLMDSRFKKLLTEDQFKTYRLWRKSETLTDNPLGFLMP